MLSSPTNLSHIAKRSYTSRSIDRRKYYLPVGRHADMVLQERIPELLVAERDMVLADKLAQVLVRRQLLVLAHIYPHFVQLCLLDDKRSSVVTSNLSFNNNLRGLFAISECRVKRRHNTDGKNLG